MVFSVILVLKDNIMFIIAFATYSIFLSDVSNCDKSNYKHRFETILPPGKNLVNGKNVSCFLILSPFCFITIIKPPDHFMVLQK